MYKCSECGEECKVKFIDLSFDHAFGREIEGFFGSDCCSMPVVDQFDIEIGQAELEEVAGNDI